MRPLRLISSVAMLACGLSLALFAQMGTIPQSSFASAGAPDLTVSRVAARLSPELALAVYEKGVRTQSSVLAGYTATTVIDAELPDSAQRAVLEVKRRYAAPSVLEFTPLHSTGDKFVTSNIIVRLLQSEVDHVHKQEQSQTAIDSDNYKFSYKGTSALNGIPVHVYDVKPRKKRVGLFKGKIFLQEATGRLVRAQGTVTKTPSFFISKIRFTQDYGMVAGFTLPTHIRSEADTRLVGKAVVDMVHRDYQPEISGGDDSRLVPVASADGAN